MGQVGRSTERRVRRMGKGALRDISFLKDGAFAGFDAESQKAIEEEVGEQGYSWLTKAKYISTR